MISVVDKFEVVVFWAKKHRHQNYSKLKHSERLEWVFFWMGRSIAGTRSVSLVKRHGSDRKRFASVADFIGESSLHSRQAFWEHRINGQNRKALD